MPKAKHHNRFRNVLSRILLFLAVSGTLLLTLEGAARLLAPEGMRLHRGGEETEDILDRRNGQFPYVLRAGYHGRIWQREVRINSLHLRSPEPDADADTTGIVRVLLLGNLIFGLGLDDRDAPAAVLEEYLGERYRVLNAGAPGYTTEHELAFLKEVGDHLRPDAVVLAYSIEDPMPGSRETRARLQKAETRLDVLSRANLWFRSHSMLYLQLKTFFNVYRIRHGYMETFRPLFNEASWAYNRPLFLEIVAWCRTRELPFFVIFFPHRDQLIEGVPTDDHPQQLVAGLGREAGFEMLDLRTVVEAEDYFPNDPLHLDRHGMAKAMQAVAEAVLPLLPESPPIPEDAAGNR